MTSYVACEVERLPFHRCDHRILLFFTRLGIYRQVQHFPGNLLEIGHGLSQHKAVGKDHGGHGGVYRGLDALVLGGKVQKFNFCHFVLCMLGVLFSIGINWTRTSTGSVEVCVGLFSTAQFLQFS